MAVHSFATNNLVKEYDVYTRYMKERTHYIKEHGIEPEPHLFIRRKHLLNSINIDNIPLTSLQRAICKWHCMVISYDVWYYFAKNCKVTNDAINHKKVVNIPDDILKKFKKNVEKHIKDYNCDYNRRVPHSKCTYDACRYLAMYWTYLGIINDNKIQRFFPDPDTWKRAAKIFCYEEGENPFQMNGMYFDWKQKNEEETKMEEANGDILEKRLEDLDFSVRTENCLYRAGVRKFGSLLMLTVNDILHIRNLGINSFREVVSKLQEYGYTYPEDKSNPRIPYVRDSLPIKEQEESVIDIAEQAAKEVEEERVMPEPPLRDLRETFNKLKDDYDKLDAMYDKLLKEKVDLDSYNVSLRQEIENLKDNMAELKSRETKLNIAANPKNLDTFALLKTILEKMRDSKMEYILVTIDGIVVDIHPKQNVPFRPTNYQIRTSESR